MKLHLRPVAGLFAASALCLTMAACATAPTPNTPVAVAPVIAKDVSSYAQPEIARVSHVQLDLSTDFAAKTLSGTAALDLMTAPGATQVILDTRDLTIRGVTDPAGRPLQWRLGPAEGTKGQPLIIDMPAGTRRVVVSYVTSPGAAALQWLTPEQTAGKRLPYLFSQGQAILTRSWLPTQDSPGIRQTYDARIVVPDNLRAVMSAEMLTPNGEAAGPGRRAYRFRMTNPIPPYLIALGVGDIAFRSLGSRTGVYTEPSMLDLAASELVDTEKMVEATERLYGPYRWGRYDLLVLPPSFPYGGMENPRLTFATPTILAGDRSLVSLVAHELAHSWSGNLVTNATWPDNWLNEGFTSYIENRIMEEVYGPERAAMEAQLSFRTLSDTVKELGATSPQTKLYVAPDPKDPEGGASEVIYEKGAALLQTIEHIVGRERFDAWLRSYFDEHAFQPMTTDRFLTHIRRNLVRGDAALEQRLQLERWLYAPGIPDNIHVPQSQAFAAVETQARAFASGTPAAQLRTQDWTTQEWLHFIGALPETMTPGQFAELDRAFRFNTTGNSEIMFAWLEKAVENRWQPAVPALEKFLVGMGRRKFVRPLFQALIDEGEWGRPLAERIYARARPGYHPVTVTSVDADFTKAGLSVG
jgi:aminopeptidase N